MVCRKVHFCICHHGKFKRLFAAYLSQSEGAGSLLGQKASAVDTQSTNCLKSLSLRPLSKPLRSSETPFGSIQSAGTL